MNKQFSIIIVFFISVLLSSCSVSKPKGFTYCYDKSFNTGLDSLVNIDGYYLTQRECDSNFYSAFTFYSDGLFCIATGYDLLGIEDCFFNNENSILCQNLSWGLYSIEGDTIKTQTLRQEGMSFCVIYRDYIIDKDKYLINISDYVKPETTKIGYMRNYPSFTDNDCPVKSKFRRTKKAKRDSSFCPYVKQNWF